MVDSQGWIACGGESGLLKVLKLDAPGAGADGKGGAAPSNLSMNQTLEGHNGTVMCVTWNPIFRKLTTSDEHGLIIVWMLHRGMWYEEMINNRNKSVVKDMKWTPDGKKICIIYEDGAVIVGSVDGNRLWGKELNIPLKFVEWSPDCRFIMFVTSETEVLLYDSDGSKIKKVGLPLLSESDPKEVENAVITGIHWYDGLGLRAVEESYALCIVFESGQVQLSRNEDDTKPVTFDAEMKITNCKWNGDGTVIALTGIQQVAGKEQSKSINLIKFYDTLGNYIRNIRIPGDEIASLSWEGSGLRLCLSVDAFIYFANIRPTYTWAPVDSSIVYSYYKPEKHETCIVFWDPVSNEGQSKYVSALKFAVSCKDLCALVVEEKGPENAPSKASCLIQLRNAIGAVIESKKISFVPKHAAMGPSNIIVATDRAVYVWQYQSAAQGKTGTSDYSQSSGRAQMSKERMFDVDNTSLSNAQHPDTFRMITDPIDDPIGALCVSDKYLVIARKSGVVQRYLLPYLSLENQYNLRCEPQRLALNRSSHKLAVIDSTGAFTMYDLDARISDEERENKSAVGSSAGVRCNVDKRDVWDMMWAEDNDDLICVMEKTKLVIFRGEVSEEPIVSLGYLASFKDLEVRAINLDDLLLQPDQPVREHALVFETASLREVRERISSDGLASAFSYTERNPHPRLWRLLAEAALEELDLGMAERAFVKFENYHGLQLVKQLRTMPDKMKAKAEVAAYLQRFDEAESIYREIDRKDLAIQLRKRIGDYTRVAQLLQTGGGNDKLVREAYDKIGEYYFDRFKWKKAATYFAQSQNMERLADCFYRLENFESLAKLREDLPDGSPLLVSLASMFESVGMHNEAADCHLRSSNPKAAVDCCVLQNRWDKALELAEQYNFPQVEGLLSRYANTLWNERRQLEVVELFRIANRPTDAVNYISEIAEQEARSNVKPALAKRLHVLSALEVERHKKKATDNMTLTALATDNLTQTIAQATAATIDTLMMTTLDTQTTTTQGLTEGGTKKAKKAFSNAWRGAAAYHFFMLAQRQFYEGYSDAAMKTSIKLCEYDDILDPRDIYSLLALTSLSNKFYGVCSKAFVKLETLPDLPDKLKDDIETLAVKIFVRHTPSDPAILSDPYVKCLTLGKSFKACVVSGRAVQDSPSTNCRTCHHPMLDHERVRVKHCPLCHTAIPATAGSHYKS